jgi:hypothetical protein
VPQWVELPGPQVLRKPGTSFTATVDPRNLHYHVLERADIFVLHLIADNSERPIYLSSTSGYYARELGISDYLLTQGLARKVLMAPPTASKDTVDLPGIGWMDVSRTRALWNQFKAPSSLIRRGDWVDRASANIPSIYVMNGYFLAEGLARAGERAPSDSVLRTAAQVATSAHLDDLFRIPTSVEPAGATPAESGDRPQGIPIPRAATSEPMLRRKH